MIEYHFVQIDTNEEKRKLTATTGAHKLTIVKALLLSANFKIINQ